jgi:hypothetical protein
VGRPTKLVGPLAWTADTFADESDSVYTLTDADKAEALDALEAFKGMAAACPPSSVPPISFSYLFPSLHTAFFWPMNISTYTLSLVSPLFWGAPRLRSGWQRGLA